MPCPRRQFLQFSLKLSAALAAGTAPAVFTACSSDRPQGKDASGTAPDRPVVSIARISNDNVERAVEEALDLLGGVAAVTRGKTRIMVKPNLVIPDPSCTTKPSTVGALVRLMKAAGKDVCIAEGSAFAPQYNLLDGLLYRTSNPRILDDMQAHVFETLGYRALARTLDVPLINLHTGDMVSLTNPGGFVFDRVSVHRAVAETDLVCSVPMMKSHVLGGVTLGMKNLMGLYPGSVYQTIRSNIHDAAYAKGSPGIAYEVLDIFRATRTGLVVVDGWYGMEGFGPTNGTLVPMNVIVAGTQPLATDLVAAAIMGVEGDQVPTFRLARQIGLKPASLADIEIRGASIASVRRPFYIPNLQPWPETKAAMGGLLELH